MPTAITPTTKIGPLVAAHPLLGPVLWKHKIDFCCGGQRTIAEAAKEQKLTAAKLIAELTALLKKKNVKEKNWTTVNSLTEIITHIRTTYHGPLAEMIPTLQTLMAKVARVHGDRHPELHEAEEILGGIILVLDMHFQKEQQILHPMMHELDTYSKKTKGMPEFHCGSIENPIRQMEYEHENYGDHLKRLRAITQEYTLPEGACTSYRVLFAELEKFEDLLIRHSHLENFALHPLALKKERALR